jgi:CRP/FNR family transcriptional regulator, cyclic AMP receptor protein
MSNVRTQVSAALRQAQLFADLSEAEMQALSARAVRKLYRPGELLFSEGEPCAGFYVVASGRVRIFKTSASGREQVLSLEGQGSSVAELPVFDGGPYPASVVAVDDSELVFVSRKDFLTFCLEHPQVALKVIAVVGARLRRLVGIIEQLSFTTVRQRLLNILVDAAQQHPSTGKAVEITLPASHQELANQIGTVRELVSRNLMRLQAEGLIEVAGRSIVVPDLAALQAAKSEE